MTAAYTTLQLVGAVTCDLVDGANFALAHSGWSPRVATLRTSQLGGRGPYTDVEEEITIDVLGATGQDVIDNLTDLMRLCDDAARFARGEAVTAVTLQLQLQGSTLAAPVQALILGGSVELPGTFNDMLMVREVAGVRLRLTRRGQWLGDLDAPGQTGASGNPAVLNLTYASQAPVTSPVGILTLTGFNPSTTPTISAGYLAVGSLSGDITIVTAETMASSPWTTVGGSGQLAESNNVARYTPADTNPNTTANTVTIAPNAAPAYAVLAAVRNNSGTTTWQLRANLIQGGYVASTPYALIDASTLNPRLILLGTAALPAAPTKMTLTAIASAASGTLDVDYLAIVALRDETVALLAHDPIALTGVLSAGAATLNVRFYPYGALAPSMYVSGTGGSIPVTYRGALPLATRSYGPVAAHTYAAWFATNGIYWAFTDSSNARVSNRIDCTMVRAYLTPQ